MKIKIEKISKRDGTTKDGRPYVQLGVFSNGKWASAFQGDWNENWKVGDEIDVEIEENGKYRNIKAPKKSNSDSQSSEVLKVVIETRNLVQECFSLLKAMKATPTHPDDLPPFDDNIDSEVPF
jgi:hypothetical protein